MIRLNLTHKLFITLLTAVCLSLAVMLILVQYSFDRGFLNYVNKVEARRIALLAENLERAYAENGNWNFLRNNYRQWKSMIEYTLPEHPDLSHSGNDPLPRQPSRQAPPLPSHKPGPSERSRFPAPPDTPRRFEHRIVMMDSTGQTLFGPTEHPQSMITRNLTFGSDTVGSLGLIPQERLNDDFQQSFAREQKITFGLIALAISCFAALLSLPLAGQMVKRIRSLAAATKQLAAGHYDIRLHKDTADELGSLINDFNTLAGTLHQNENLRRQWVADISHELRTPLAVLRGEIEAIQDNIRRADEQTLASLHSEVMRLNRLVDDLFQLSLSDIGALTYRKTELEPAFILDETVDSFSRQFTEQNISISKEWENDGITVHGDPDRLAQLFTNLLENSLKYTNPGGKLHISLASAGGEAVIQFQDSEPGVDSAKIGKLFDRLYRAEGSRSRQTGGAGLGLAICKNIVRAHGGTISAEPSRLNGLTITIKLPIAQRQ